MVVSKTTVLFIKEILMHKSIVKHVYTAVGSALILPLLFGAPFVSPPQAWAAETGAEPVPVSTAGSGIPELVLSKCYLLESENYESIADGYYQAVLLSEKSAAQYPALNQSLAELNRQITDRCMKDFGAVAADSRQYLETYEEKDPDLVMPSGSLENSITPLRQDDHVLSFFSSCYSYIPGAAHGLTSYSGYTLDTATGERILLDDVVRDKEDLAKAVSENLIYMSTGEPASDYSETLKDYFASGEYSPAWVLDNSGLLVRFAPSEIGSYAEGPMEAEIPFSRYPDLFTDKYGSHTGAYALPVGTVYPVKADLNGDGTTEKISLNARLEEGPDAYAYTALRVALGDKECLHESYFYTARGVLLHESDKRSYLYVQMITDNEYPIIAVFDLSGDAPVFVGELNGTGLTAKYRQDSSKEDMWYLDEALICDPACFSLDSRMNLMSTYAATRTYKLGADGMPEPLTDFYTINSDLELTSLKELTADVIDPASDTVTKKGAVIPKGTALKLLRTNGTDIVDLTGRDGTVYRFRVVGTWPQMVNGVDLSEAFEGTMFAG